MKSRLVIYHANCHDGVAAAWAAYERFGDGDTEYVAQSHGSPLAQSVSGRDVIFLDFAMPRENMLAIERAAASLVVLDHHKTAADDLVGCSFATFDMNRSGAGLAWDTFHPGKQRPWVINYVEDRDLWRFQLPDSKAVNAYLSARSFETVYAVQFCSEMLTAEDCAEYGRAVIMHIDSYIEDMVQHARTVTFEGCSVPVVNAPPSSLSELVGKLAEAAPFAMGWFQRGDGVFAYSLRSRGPDGVDVSAIAKRYGGGGHKNAAGFQSKTMLEFM